jgi:hypothetical protein
MRKQLRLFLMQAGIFHMCSVSHRVHAVLVSDHFPELGANLVAALASLNVNNLTHDEGVGGV